MDSINQKEYLKKYLGIGKAPGEKKKKKKGKGALNRITIIDDDVDINFSTTILDEDAINEDAPQIVAIIDERPPSLRVDDKTKNPLWQPIGSSDNMNVTEQKQIITGFKLNKSIARSNNNSVSQTDRSPPRRKVVRDDNSPPRKYRSGSNSPSARTVIDDNSPPRKSRSDDNSPPRKSRRHDYSPRNKRAVTESRTPDNSPPRNHKKKSEALKIVVTDSPSIQEDKKIKPKTLDGKTAGLQSAQQLVEETKQFRAREDQQFKELPKEQSGENAATILRDRKTGKIRNLQEEHEYQRKKQEEEDKNKEKYTRWGRGLVQVESRDQQIKEELYEMGKPLARYADDEDLEAYLKEQEREGDPMLAYIRSKKRKKAAKAGEVAKPQFEGQFMPNRFGIKPGHRWDGVDRSNGYEKKWFEVQNARHAQQEENYKWSTEDM